MDKIIVEGGKRLTGSVAISGAKNAALPILASALLTTGRCTYTNVPDLQDIRSILRLLESLGAEVSAEARAVSIDAARLEASEAPYDLVRKMRASILVLCPLVARLGHARVSLPGGCAIGARPINLHLKGLERLGAVIDIRHGYVEARADRLKGAEIYFDTVTVTGTENIMMAAALADGVTVLRNAAREPEVVALARVLTRMGADIRGAGTSVVTIQGVSELNPVEAEIIPDRIEAGTYMAAAAVTGGDVTLTDCQPDHLSAVCDKLRQAGVELTVSEAAIRVVADRPLTSVDVRTQTYPGFPTDMQAQFMVLMACADGQSIIKETIFENRFIHVSELRRLGADITVSADTAVVRGVKALLGAPVMASDLRASASLVLAGLVAEGTTEINRVYHIDRGYERIEEKLRRLGASIWRERG